MTSVGMVLIRVSKRSAIRLLSLAARKDAFASAFDWYGRCWWVIEPDVVESRDRERALEGGWMAVRVDVSSLDSAGRTALAGHASSAGRPRRPLTDAVRVALLAWVWRSDGPVWADYPSSRKEVDRGLARVEELLDRAGDLVADLNWALLDDGGQLVRSIEAARLRSQRLRGAAEEGVSHGSD